MKQCVTLEIRGPQGEVVPEELHDEGGVLVALLTQSVQLGDGFIKGLLGQLARLLGTVEDLIVKDGKVESQSKSDGMGGGKLTVGVGAGLIVSIQAVV